MNATTVSLASLYMLIINRDYPCQTSSFFFPENHLVMLQNLTVSISLFTKIAKRDSGSNQPFYHENIPYFAEQVSLSVEKHISLLLCWMLHLPMGPTKLQASKWLKILKLALVFSRTCKLKLSWCVRVRSHTIENAPVCILLFASIVKKNTWE